MFILGNIGIKLDNVDMLGYRCQLLTAISRDQNRIRDKIVARLPCMHQP